MAAETLNNGFIVYQGCETHSKLTQAAKSSLVGIRSKSETHTDLKTYYRTIAASVAEHSCRTRDIGNKRTSDQHCTWYPGDQDGSQPHNLVTDVSVHARQVKTGALDRSHI